MKVFTDEELLQASGRGDQGAFTVLVERHHRGIIRFVHRFLATADRATAEDLAQQVFLNAWKCAPTFRPRATVATWLYRIAANACRNYRRYERLRKWVRRLDRSAEAGQDDYGEGAGLQLAETERAQQVRGAIARLPANQRAAIVLRYFHEFSYAEIAEILETSTSAVDSLLHRARRALYDKLSRKMKEISPQIPSH